MCQHQHDQNRVRRDLLGLGLILGLTSTGTRAQTTADPPSLPLPAGLVAPWRTPGIDPESLRQAREPLAAAHRLAASTWLASPTSLRDLVASKRPLPLNLRRSAAQILVGPTKDQPLPRPVIVEPTWCGIMNRYVLMVTVADASSNELLGAAHRSTNRETWDQLARTQGLTPFVNGQITTLVQEALGRSRAKLEAPPARDALHLGLTLELNTTRRDEGSSLCLNMLLEETLVGSTAPEDRGFTVARSLGLDHLAMIRNALGLPSPPLRRPTRTLVMGWQSPSTPPSPMPPRELPRGFRVNVRPVETVFGESIKDSIGAEDLTLMVSADGRVKMELGPQLKSFVDRERQSLLLTDWPQVAKVDRAWAYLDRGRAWGLKVNDRMITGTGESAIKGHVVRFFGPEAGLKSPRGFPIREGAILYLRKNQNEAQVGQEFRMDPRTFPTPWPPTP